MRLTSRLKHAWDIFRNRDPTSMYNRELGPASSYRDNRRYFGLSVNRANTASVYTRISVDVASIAVRHVRLDENGRFSEIIEDSLNECLTVSPNKDQTPRAFIQDAVYSMLEEGYCAIFPESANLDPTENPNKTFDIFSMRTGKIIEWYPDFVKIEAYNPQKGYTEQIILPKEITLILENPFYAVMNAPNSTMQRLIRKLDILDVVDNQIGSGKMDLIIQMPYQVNSDLRREQSEKRRKDIELQLTGSKYGIAYIGATERVTQLNRPIENNILTQVEYLENKFYSELGLTPGVFNGTASEEENLNYNNRTIEPIVAAIVDEMKRKWLTKTARTQGQSIMYFKDPFKLVPVNQIAEIADKFTRNEILTSNEIRGLIGMKPSSDPKADELRNSNIAASKQENEETIAPKSDTDDAPIGEEE